MKALELASRLGAEVVEAGGDSDITAGYTSALLSAVVARAPEGSALITIQGHLNTVAVATLAGIRAIVLANRRPAPDDMRTAARREGIAILRSAENQFILSHRLHVLLHGP